MSTTPRTFLWSSTMNPCSLRRDWIWENRPGWMCAECGEVKTGSGGVDLYIQEDWLDDVPLSMVSGCGVGVIQTAFVELLQAAVAGNLEGSIKIGRVFGPNGKLTENWRSFHGDPRVVVRGESPAGCRVCPCQRCHYFAQGRQYLCPAPSESLEVNYAGLGSLVVSERIRTQILVRSWRSLEVERLPILDQPLDGLPPALPC